ncbi:MAG: ribosome maturation factor RimM [Actinobacteria bacterium]|nr:ribosome maturation factor RimM [Actinomycetota bacterium]
MRSKELLRLGRIVKPHGLRGKVEVYLFNSANPALHENLSILTGEDETGALAPARLTIRNIQRKPSGNLIISFDQVTTIEQAEALRGACIFADRNDMELDDDEYFVDDLKGMEVHDAGAAVGRVAGSYTAGAGEVIIVTTPEGDVDFPLTDENLEFIDWENNALRVNNFGDFHEYKYKGKKKRKP